MRLDKFMKVSRLSKRRSEAHEALVHGRITKDGKELKPGYQVKPGDVLQIHYATKFVTRARARSAAANDAGPQTRRSLRDFGPAQRRTGGVDLSLSADTKDALARDVPEAAHCRQALLHGLALYGRTRDATILHHAA